MPLKDSECFNFYVTTFYFYPSDKILHFEFILLLNSMKFTQNLSDLPEIPDSIKKCKELHSVDFSNNPLQK